MDLATQVLKSSTMQTTTMEITPETASLWLEGNTHNRPLHQKTVERFAKMMTNKQWVLNGESIIFGQSGRLLDGQHRLWACIESQTPFRAAVVLGAPDDSFTTIDQGRHRAPSDHLSVAGLVNNASVGKSVASTAILILKYRTNNIFNKEYRNPIEIVELVKQEPRIIEWVTQAKRAPKGLSGWSSHIAALLHIGSYKNNDDAEVFLHKWNTGADLEPGSPILTLRQRVLSRPPYRSWERFFSVASAWNAFVQGRPLFKMGSIQSDKFPKIEGGK